MDSFAEEILSKILTPPQLGGLTSKLGEARVLALQGDLGAGKTAFVKSLGKILGVKKTILSPTFIIMKSYKLKAGNWKLLIHIDAYRIENENELEILGWDDLIKNPENLIALEWPEKVRNLIPKTAKTIKFEFVDEKTRELKVKL